jgi:hypothetical protein
LYLPDWIPRSVYRLDEKVFEIEDVEDRWYDPNAEYFKVRTVDGKRFLLRCDAQTSEWTLQTNEARFQ